MPASALPRLADATETSEGPAERRFGTKAVVMATLIMAHIAVLAALISANVIHLQTAEVKPLVVELMPERKVPPPAAPAPDITPIAIVVPKISAPDPIIVTEAAPVVIAAAPPTPPQAVIIAAKAVPAAGPVSAGDLSATMIEAVPPRYPVESRRRREQGAVLLMVLLRKDGAVEDISVSRSSGFERLDKAALDAVRRWRWSPTLRAGEAMAVRGIVEIPFVLKR